MTYPRLTIDLNKILENTQHLVKMTKSNGIDIWGVTKGCSADINVAQCMLNGGCGYLMDSRIKNLYSLRSAGITAPLFMLRIPMLSELDCILEVANGTLVSTAEAIEALEMVCASRRQTTEVIVMLDVGDLREGVNPEDVVVLGKKLKSCAHLHCVGVGTNVGCFGGVQPSVENLKILVDSKKILEDCLGYPILIVSGGGTSSLDLIYDRNMPHEINNLRIGEGILLGTNTMGTLKHLTGLHTDAFILEAEVVEVYIKPSKPYGKIGVNAFDEIPYFEDNGLRLRVIIAIGRQDVDIKGLIPLNHGIKILGASSDHLILDAEDCPEPPSYGQKLKFAINYSAMLALTTSKYVEKIYIGL